MDRWGLDAQEKLASARARLVAALDEVEQAEKLVASDLPTTVRVRFLGFRCLVFVCAGEVVIIPGFLSQVLERTSRRKLAFLREEHG